MTNPRLQAASKAARLFAEKLEEAGASVEHPADRRKAAKGRMYTQAEFEEWYGNDRGEVEWEKATIAEEYNWGEEAAGMIGAALWPREMPEHMIMGQDGEIAMAAATVAPSSVVDALFGTLLRVRQAEFASCAGYENPDAWNTGVAEPGVEIDTHTQLAETGATGQPSMENAWGRWRRQWQERIPLTAEQELQQAHSSHSAFGKKMRQNFNAFVHNYMGEVHVAKFIIRCGVGPQDDIQSITKFIEELIALKEKTGRERARCSRACAQFTPRCTRCTSEAT